MSLTTKIKPLVLVGCSGSGRSAIMYRLIHNLPHKFQRLISYTTRKPRPSQVNNRDFYFVQQSWIKQNENKFVTLTYSGNNNYYGLTGEEIARIMKKNKIPIFKMTLDAYCKNISQNNNVSISTSPTQKKSKDFNSLINQAAMAQLERSSNLCLIRDRKIQCNALYITLPSLKQLERRLKFSPFSQQQRLQKIQKAKLQHRQAQKYFQKENIIGQYFDRVDQNVEQYQDFQDKIMRVQSRLFQLY